MHRLNFLADERWDEQSDDDRTRFATRHPERPVPEGGDSGVIARFDLPPGR